MLLTKEFIISLLLLLLLSDSLHAQANLNFNGSFTVGKYKGSAEFGYQILSNRDTVFNGPFLMQHSNLPDLLSKKDSYFSFQGTFRNNIPEGSWRFSFGEFLVDTTEGVEVSKYQYTVKTKGIHDEASGIILAGRPHGKWTQIIQRIKASQVDETLFRSEIDFNRGIPQKGFRIQNERRTLMGRFLRDGLAHDVWELYSTDVPGATESWHFTEGVLNKITIYLDDSTISVPMNTAVMENPHILNLNDRYLEIIRLNQRLTSDHSVEIKDEMTELLAENGNHYLKIDNILSKLGESSFMPEFKVKLDHKPLDVNNINLLDSIKILHDKSDRISKELLKNTQLNILKLSDDKTLFLMSVISEITKKHLWLLQEVTEFYDLGILPFVPLENILTKLWPQGVPSTNVSVTYEEVDDTVERIYTGPNAESYRFDKDGIAGVYELSQYVSGCLESIQYKLRHRLTLEQRQKELMALEETLIAEVATLNLLVDSLLGSNPDMPNSAINDVKTTARRELSLYSALEGITEKPYQARLLTGCFKQLQDLSLTLAMLPDHNQEIKQTYTDQVWNPFTATLMNEEVKKRLTEAYNEVLIPYLLAELKNNLSCENVTHLKLLMESTHQRMLLLRNEDTKKLERRLRGERDPLAIMKLFGIQTEIKVDGL